MTHHEINKMVEALFAMDMNETDIGYFVVASIGG